MLWIVFLSFFTGYLICAAGAYVCRDSARNGKTELRKLQKMMEFLGMFSVMSLFVGLAVLKILPKELVFISVIISMIATVISICLTDGYFHWIRRGSG